jgi:hypothetical protein
MGMHALKWLYSTDYRTMLREVTSSASDRKLRLFGCACVRVHGTLLQEEGSRRAFFVAERHADGLASPEEVQQAHAAARSSLAVVRGAWADPSWWRDRETSRKVCAVAEAVCLLTRPDLIAWDATWSATQMIFQTMLALDTPSARRAGVDWVNQTFSDLLRDVVGNPFQEVIIDPTWRMAHGGRVGRVAEAIYEDRSFDELPVLADALEEAGCADEVVLAHCRAAGDHGRGCWAVDALLGKN